MNHLNCRISILLLAPTLLLGGCGSSGESPQGAAIVQEGSAPAQVTAPVPAGVAASAPAAVPETAPPAAAALREFRDPVTGQPREPTAAELKALAAATQNASKAGTGAAPKDREIVFPNGTVAVEEGALSEMKGCVQKDGKVTVDHDCRSDAPAAAGKP